MGGATLIAGAIAVFVVLVSAQVFSDWPIAALGGGDDSTAVSSAQPARGSSGLAAPASGGAAAGPGNGASSPGAPGAQRGGIGAVGGQPGAAGAGNGAGEGSGGGSEPPASAQNPATASPGGNAGAGAGSGGGAGSSGGGGAGTASTPSGKVTETVNGTVDKVDESALGGALGNSGATEVTEGVVNGVVGPESTVGQVVDETVGVVGGLLHPNR